MAGADEGRGRTTDVQRVIADNENHSSRFIVKETKPVDLSGASYDATSAALFCEAEKAFTDDDTLSWTSDGDAPQTIWVQFKEVGDRV